MAVIEVTEEDADDRTKMETENVLWGPLMGVVERKRKSNKY